MHLFLQFRPRGLGFFFRDKRGGGVLTRGTPMHIQSIYTGLHHRNLEHNGCTFKSMHRPTMSNVVKKEKMYLDICNYNKTQLSAA